MNDFEQAIELLRKVQQLLIEDDFDDLDITDQLWALNIDKFLLNFESHK